MYEGKNIHYSPIDQKPLCSFSGKVCNQRRLNKYGFCVRHILEDPDAPFKRCAYVAKSSKQTCTQPIPRNEERQYCNNHMQVLGMLPKKERKPKKEKEKDRVLQASVFAAQLEHKELFQNQIRAKIAADSVKNQIASIQNSVGRDDVEDIYAFPTDPGEAAEKGNRISTIITSVGLPDSSAGTVKTVNYVPHKTTSESGSSGSSSLAKIYPELAEKLEKIKPKIETKVKGKVKSSRTMNSLQTKIAQNKIKDKLKRNHESSASSQSQSPSSSFNSANSPGFNFRTSSPSGQAESPGNSVSNESKMPPVSEEMSGKEKVTASTTLLTTDSPHLPAPSITPLPTLTQHQLNSLGFPSLNLSFGQFGLPLPMASDVEETLKQLAKVTAIPPEGALFPSEGAAGVLPRLPLAGLPAGALIPTADLLTLHHLLRPTLAHQSGPPPPYPGTQNRSSCPTVNPLPTVNITSQPPAEKASNQVNNVNVNQTKHGKTEVMKHTTASVSTSASSVSTTSVSALPVKSGESRKMTAIQPPSLPLNQVKPSKSRTPKSKISPVCKNRTPMALLTMPISLSKTRKVKNVLSESEMKKLKTESAIKYYRTHKKRKIDNHHLLVSEFGSSDSDSSDCDMLPWQPDWFSASSDEELGDDEEEDQTFDLRTTKLALSRARLRRQCFQSRRSYCANSYVQEQDAKSLSALIAAARENPRVAVKSIYEVSGNHPKPVDKYKRRGLEKRKCCYKNDDDVQCQNLIVPYTNHCIKHVMYNVDQQLFEYCTAKFADNTQCCVPVIDLKHELPLCMEHGIKADNYMKLQDSEPKPKRPRKKTKPSALTRPPKKGKKKKNQRKITRPQKPLPPELPTGDTDMPDTEEELHATSHDEGDDDEDEDADKTDEDESPQKAAIYSKMAILKATPSVQPRPQRAEPVRRVSPPKLSEKLQKVSSLEELENLGGLPELENEKMFGELPLETASKLLEENDFQDVLSRLPDETFDIFTNKNGMFEPTNEEVEELEKSIAMANKDFKYAKDSYEQISTSQTTLPPILDDADELTKQIAEEILSQNLGPAVSSHSINTADAQESIKAIARSLSTSGQLLAPQSSFHLEFSENQDLLNTTERHTNPPLSVPLQTQSFTEHSFARKDSVPNVSVPVQTTIQQSFPQISVSSDQNSANLSSVMSNSSESVLSTSVTIGPSHVSVPVTCKVSSKQLETGSVLQSGEKMLTRVPNIDSVNVPANLSLPQQQLLHLMQQQHSVRPQTPVQYQTIPSPSQRPSIQLPVSPLQLPQPLTAEQLLEKQRIIQQQKQQLEAQQQQLARQQQQLEALTQQKQQLDSLSQQQQNLDTQQLLQQHILQQLGTALPPPPQLNITSQSIGQQQQIVQQIQQQQALSQQQQTLATVSQQQQTLPNVSQQQQSLTTVSQQQQALATVSQQKQTLAAISQDQQTLSTVSQEQQKSSSQLQQTPPSQPAVITSSVVDISSTQPVALSNLPQYVNSVSQLQPPLLSQDPKSNAVLQTAHLIELQRQLALYAQQQQQLLVQQNLATLPRVSDRNVHMLAQSQPLVLQAQVQKSQQQVPNLSKPKSLTNTVPSYQASTKAAASQEVVLVETPSKTVASVVTTKPQVNHMQHGSAKHATTTTSRKRTSSPGSDKPTAQKHKQTQSNVDTKTATSISQSLSESSVSRAPIVTSQSSLLSKIDPKTMTTKALEQHIVQMAYQQALAKQNEEDLEKSKNAKKVVSKKTSQKGTKRNTASSKKVKEIPKTPEMLSRQSELEQQLAQLAQQNMLQKHVHQKTFVKQAVSLPSTDLLKHVTTPTTTIAWKPIPSTGQKFANGIPVDPAYSKSFPSVGNVTQSSVNKTVNFNSSVNVSLTTTSPLTARQVSKHLGPPPSYHHTMTAALSKSSSAPS